MPKGIYKRTATHARNLKQLTGQKFGYLLAKEYVGQHQYKHSKSHMYLCICICGKQVTVIANNLVQGNSTSCGCRSGETKHIKLAGKTFGYWSIVSMAERDYLGRIQYLCKCKCG